MAGGISDLEEGKIILAHGKIDLNRGQGQGQTLGAKYGGNGGKGKKEGKIIN